ncbi:hypothetical protein HN51_060042 [Arachis hypogaea]|uniref:Uncharacterized protein n=1 Tax=Arachis hypogaea TaxID=3818 RepID=A0A444X8B2_ARAHY|nr:transcription factor MYB90-like [Arachis ipaensis]XP_025680453.1 transcription factor MYB90-like [Arachis hypogaea]QHN83602.1 Transcription factor [Arachis hypogaea]RYQ85919.1 hypothetical protein Ahy_B10g105560 [Arachis hypogaea]
MEGSIGLRKGAWAKVEDDLLRACVEQYGEGKWHLVPSRAGLNRCRKSCRLRWLNYLKPNIKRGEFAEDEVDLMIRMHRLLGNRWSLIAGRLPGRTPNDVKNYWNTYVRRNNKHTSSSSTPSVPSPSSVVTTVKRHDHINHQVIKPHPRTFSKASPWLLLKKTSASGDHNNSKQRDGAKAEEECTDNNNNGSGGGCDDGDTCRDKNGGKGDEEKLNDGCLLSVSGAEEEEEEEEEDWKLLLPDFNWDAHNDDHFLKDASDADQDMLINVHGQTWSDILLDINLWDPQ